jgi:hypothetical protein
MVPKRNSKGKVMKNLISVIAVAVIGLSGNTTTLAADGRSLADVAATVADALAAGDAAVLQRYWITYEEAAALAPQKVGGASDFLQAKKEWKQQTDDTWKEIREAKLLVDHIKIEEVRIKKVKDIAPDRYKIVAIAVPVFRLKGALRPVPMMAMYFVQARGEWKYVYR